MNFNWVVLVGARFIRLTPKGAGKHLTDRWYNVGTTSCIFSPSSSRCDNILFTPKFSSVSGMPFFSNAVPVYSAVQFPGLVGTCCLASWRGLGADQSHLQGKRSPGNPAKTNGGPIWE